MGTMMTMLVTGFVGGEVTVRQIGEQWVASFISSGQSQELRRRKADVKGAGGSTVGTA
jgi:hypothetical protein